MKPIHPFEPVATHNIPKGDQWIGQVKWDGVRILTYYDGKTIQLFNRRKNERTMQYPELLDPSAFIHASSCILDGEIVTLHNGKPSFYKVMKRDRLRKMSGKEALQQEIPITYMVFDILYLNGQWLLDKPLIERQQLLNRCIKPNDTIQLVENFADKATLFQACMENDLEGVVYKDLTSIYVLNGKDGRWKKQKKEQDLIAIVGGVSMKDDLVRSLHLGLLDENQNLYYIGSAGSGKLTNQDWMLLSEMIRPLIRQKNPFHNEVHHPNKIWLNPILTVKVTFMEWIENKTLRHPIIEAFVDIPVEECTFLTNRK